MSFAHATRAAQEPAPFADTPSHKVDNGGDAYELASPFDHTEHSMAQPDELDVIVLYLRDEILHALLQAVQKAVGVRND